MLLATLRLIIPVSEVIKLNAGSNCSIQWNGKVINHLRDSIEVVAQRLDA
jgi:hypothetical protein